MTIDTEEDKNIIPNPFEIIPYTIICVYIYFAHEIFMTSVHIPLSIFPKKRKKQTSSAARSGPRRFRGTGR